MTNEEQLELIAQASELCEKRISFYEHEYEIEPNDLMHEELNSWTTHLAEMDEHKKNRFIDPTSYGEKWICKVCGKDCPCDFLVTKAKRLLGATNDN